MMALAAGDAMRQWDGLLAAQGREGRRLCDRDAGARAQRERDVAGAEDFISRGEVALWCAGEDTSTVTGSVGGDAGEGDSGARQGRAQARGFWLALYRGAVRGVRALPVHGLGLNRK
jgi:hypothetical protein